MKIHIPILNRASIPHFIRYFFFGFFFIAAVHLSGSCSKSESPVESIPPVTTDVSKINEGAKTAETALLTGDPAQISKILTEDSKEAMTPVLSQLSKEELIAIGNAFKSREIKTYGEQYAEYTFTKDGQTFTAAFAKQDDESWKLIRL